MKIDLSQVHKVIIPKFLPLLYDKGRNIVMRGSAGSGKSHFASQKCLIRIAADYELSIKHKILVLRKTLPAAKDSVLPLFLKYIEQWGFSPLIKSVVVNPICITFTNGSQILIRGLDEPEKIKSIEGVTSMWLEEANQFHQGDYDELNRRLRGNLGTYKQIMITFNPVSKYVWLYDQFFNQHIPNTTLHHSTFKDNPYIMNDPEYVQVLEQYKKDKNPFNYQVYYLGEWGVLSEIIYTNYDMISIRPDAEETIYGIDFGYSNPCAIVEVRLSNKDYYVRQRLYASDMTILDLIEWLNHSEINKNDYIYADCADPGAIEEIYRAGWNIHPANKSVENGIDFCKRGILSIDTHSPDLIKEIQNYSYKTDKNGKVIGNGVPKKENDHLMDAMRYSIYSHYSNRGEFHLTSFNL